MRSGSDLISITVEGTDLDPIRYQFLHRTASAVLKAEAGTLLSVPGEAAVGLHLGWVQGTTRSGQ